MKKKLLVLVLTLALCFALAVPTFGAEVSYAVNGGVIYFDAATGTVTGCQETVYEANIPSEIYGIPVTAIGDGAFNACRNLRSVSIPNGVERIEYYAFSGCKSLTSVIIPDSVIDIGSGAFSDCSGLVSVVLSNKITTVYSNTFSWCNHLLNVTIPSSVSRIDSGAFEQCMNLHNVYYEGTVLSWSAVEIAPDNSALIDAAFHFNAVGCQIPGGTVFFETTTGTIIGGDFESMSGDVVIPPEIGGVAVTSINALPGYDMTGVTIPYGVISIGDGAFSYCVNLRNVTIPNSVMGIGYGAFEGCFSLSNITIPDSVASVGSMAFYECTSLQNVSIGSGVASIEDGVFLGCGALKAVTIGSGVTQIKSGAFAECDSLRDVYYSGSEAQWKAIEIDETNGWNNSLRRAAIHCNTVFVTVHGTPVAWTDAAPFVDENDRTMVPLRAVADAMGLYVDWIEDTREAYFTDGTKTIYFPIGSSTAHDYYGEEIPMDTAAVIVNDRTYAPVRYLAEFFGYAVDWNGDSRTVLLQ